VLVVVRVPFTLVTACPACLGARLHNRAGELGLKFGLSAEDPACGIADVAAVEAEPDAADDRADVLLTEARVGARRAALGAIETRIDARKLRACLDRSSPWMRLQHLLSMGHDFLLA
jgi:hypothetical protein